ncbi:MAG: hypothetical protein ILM98_11700 [Kiritimatiellae bacterium]|nr:hypothetical protein [Kiritimatiellia bacterium]
MKKSHILAALCATATCAAMVASAEVKSSVFDDVKVWYKGSAGNAVGTADSSAVTKIKNLPQLADSSSSMHGGDYGWWGWRIQYTNQKVDCPYAGVTLDSTPCMVVPSYAEPTGYATVTINGEETTQPYWTARRFGDLHFTNWMSDWPSGTVCSNWTCVLRFRSDQVNQVSGNANHVIDIGSSWNETAGAATGVSLNLNTPVALADYASPRTFVTTTQKNYTNIKIKSGRWVDCAIAVNGQTLTLWFCWNDGTDETPTNKLAKITEVYPTTQGLPTIPAGCRVHLASTKDAYSATFTNGVYNADMLTKAFEGAFHQVAFWDRTLSDDEIREAMAGGTWRPNLVDVGMEGNGVAEFAATPTKTTVSNDGDWENLNPALTAENPTATISFTCPALWAGMPQWLRVAGAGAGKVSVSLNNEALGTVNIHANGASSFFVPEGKILSGANTLVLTRTSGSPVLDAVRLGGSWKFGESVTSFNSTTVSSSLASTIGVDCWKYHPACGNDKLHARGTTWNINGDNLSFPFFVPSDMVGKFRGVLTFKSATAGSTPVFKWLVNDANVCEDTSISGQSDYSTTVAEAAFVSGWNEAVWHRTTGWINFNSFQFTLVDAPKPTIIVLE